MRSRTVETLLVLVVFLLALLVDMVARYLRWEGMSTAFADLAATLVVVTTGVYLLLAVVTVFTADEDDPLSLAYSVLAPPENEKQ
ncbi:hypothetical protein [Haloarchaeobius sp. DT45]|uniref:hypothetical protein n=1 Tax=Haloarchaeobius sp. DT45 TaxID=3446116 RepID=UPI003F6B997C